MTPTPTPTHTVIVRSYSAGPGPQRLINERREQCRPGPKRFRVWTLGVNNDPDMFDATTGRRIRRYTVYDGYVWEIDAATVEPLPEPCPRCLGVGRYDKSRGCFGVVEVGCEVCKGAGRKVPQP